MDIDEISAVVLEVLKDIQEMSGRDWCTPTSEQNLIGQLEGFDSLCSIEATAMIEDKLGLGETGFDSFFVSEDGQKALSLMDVATRIEYLRSQLGVESE